MHAYALVVFSVRCRLEMGLPVLFRVERKVNVIVKVESVVEELQGQFTQPKCLATIECRSRKNCFIKVFDLLNTKEHILQNVGKQTVLGHH